MYKMCLTILAVIFTSRNAIANEVYDTSTDYTLYKECYFNWTRAQEIILYKPTVHYITNIITSNPIAEDFYGKYTTFIDKFGPRPTGSPTLERAIDHMVDLTLESGLYNVTTEKVVVPRWSRGFESLRMILPRPKNITILGLGPSVATPSVGVIAEVMVFNSFKEFAAADHSVVGKIILFNAPYTTFEETVNYRLHGATIAAKKGAVAVLIRSITPFSLYTPHTGLVKYEKGIKQIPAAALTLEDADFLQRVYSSGTRIVVHLTMFNQFALSVSRNVVVDLRGDKEPEKLIIVSGHIDSWDVGNGVIDNGGGMMISWFVPVILNHLSLRPKRTIRAILWASEELGFVGVGSYLKQHLDELHNVDFIMESDTGTFAPVGLEVAGSQNIRCLMASILKLFTPIHQLKDAYRTGSAITLFEGLGIPGATLLNENDMYYWYYHSAADTLSAQNKTDVIDCAAFWAAVAYIIADLPFKIPN